MHLSLEELLAVRDGEATTEAGAHADSCPECTAEIARLRAVQRALAALPEQRPSQDLWPALRTELASRRQHRRWVLAGWAAAGLAAAFTVVIGVRGGLEAWHEAKLARETRELVAASQQLEQQLRTADRGGRVVFFPAGSPIIPVKSPIRKITWCPRSWNWRILLSSTVCPRCRSGAVGSNPALTRRGRPDSSL